MSFFITFLSLFPLLSLLFLFPHHLWLPHRQQQHFRHHSSLSPCRPKQHLLHPEPGQSGDPVLWSVGHHLWWLLGPRWCQCHLQVS